MDLRQRKTLKALRNAFLHIRAFKPLEKITVKELAESAEISKATFYLHYKDIYDLSEQLQKETVEYICAGIAHPDMIITDPAEFAKELFLAFQSQQTLIDILFSKGQESILPQSIEKELRQRIYKTNIELKNDITLNVMLTYEIQGGYYAYIENTKRFSCDDVIDEISKIVRVLSKEIKK